MAGFFISESQDWLFRMIEKVVPTVPFVSNQEASKPVQTIGGCLKSEMAFFIFHRFNNSIINLNQKYFHLYTHKGCQ